MAVGVKRPILSSFSTPQAQTAAPPHPVCTWEETARRRSGWNPLCPAKGSPHGPGDLLCPASRGEGQPRGKHGRQEGTGRWARCLRGQEGVPGNRDGGLPNRTVTMSPGTVRAAEVNKETAWHACTSRTSSHRPSRGGQAGRQGQSGLLIQRVKGPHVRRSGP